MNVDELKKLKEEIQIQYDKEKKLLSTSPIEKERTLIEEELNDISRELLKITKLIEIYQTNQPDALKEAKLEMLYMQLMSGIDEENFNTLDQDKLFELFEKCFSNDWVYIEDTHQKEELLLEAICSNKIIRIKSTTKALNNFYGEM